MGICAYNEEANIRQCLESVSGQSPDAFTINEIIVVSSASTDQTDEIVREYSSIDERVRLSPQEKREGKSSAVNQFMREANGDILVLVNADNRLEKDTFQHLLNPFLNREVGMVGGHPIPVNDSDTLAGFAVHMLWDLHHRLSMINPKTGELIAFRNLRMQISPGINTDEDWIRMKIEGGGLRTKYAPDAIVWNKGPETLSDFWKQRTRVNIGEKYMQKRYKFEVPTWKGEFLLPSLLSFLRDNRGHPMKLMLSIGIEAFSRLYASLHVALDRGDPYVWEVVGTTKRLD